MEFGFFDHLSRLRHPASTRITRRGKLYRSLRFGGSLRLSPGQHHERRSAWRPRPACSWRRSLSAQTLRSAPWVYALRSIIRSADRGNFRPSTDEPVRSRSDASAAPPVELGFSFDRRPKNAAGDRMRTGRLFIGGMTEKTLSFAGRGIFRFDNIRWDRAPFGRSRTRRCVTACIRRRGRAAGARSAYREPRSAGGTNGLRPDAPIARRRGGDAGDARFPARGSPLSSWC